MYSNQSSYAFSEFYEGIQDIQTNFDYSDSYGKTASFAKPSKGLKGFKKNISAQSFSLLQGQKGSVKKSSSSNTFSERDYEPNSFGGKFISNQVMFNEESTKDSHSPFSSVTSLSSVKAQAKKKIPSEMDFKTKYKTEVCRYWAENGYCEFGETCAFAHGGNEIRQKAFVASNYKTKKCVSFHETGYCVYGIRCQFLHCFRKDCSTNPKLMYSTYREELDNVETWVTENQDCMCLRRKNRSRLPVMERLSLENNITETEETEEWLTSISKAQ